MNTNINNPLIKAILSGIQRYDHNKYWKRRNIVIDKNNKTPKIFKFYYLYKIKKSDAFNNASMGTDINFGAKFSSKPNLPHGLNGIIVSPYAKIGKNCTIHQQVTIATSNNRSSAVIGDNCYIGAGAKILGNVKIGDNVKIGANAVVVKDVPNNCTVVGVPAKIVRDARKSMNRA